MLTGLQSLNFAREAGEILALVQDMLRPIAAADLLRIAFDGLAPRQA